MGFLDKFRKKGISVKNKDLNTSVISPKQEKGEKTEEFLKKKYNYIITVQKNVLKESEISYHDFCNLTLEEINDLEFQIKKRGIDTLKDKIIRIRNQIDGKIMFDDDLSFLKEIEPEIKKNIVEEINNKSIEINYSMEIITVTKICNNIVEIYNKVNGLTSWIKNKLNRYQNILSLAGMDKITGMDMDKIKRNILILFDNYLVEKYSVVELSYKVEKLFKSIDVDLQKKIDQQKQEEANLRKFNTEVDATITSITDHYLDSFIDDINIDKINKYHLEIAQEKLAQISKGDFSEKLSSNEIKLLYDNFLITEEELSNLETMGYDLSFLSNEGTKKL